MDTPGTPTGAPIVKAGTYRYRLVHDWAKLPRGWSFGDADPALRPPRSVMKGACNAAGESIVVCRGAHPVIVFDAEGRFVTAWGEGRFSPWLHSVTVLRDGTLFLVDTAAHAAFRHAPDGTLLQTIGRPGMPAPTFAGRPFNMPTGVAEAPDGTLYISDGYGNRRVHRFAPDGTHRLSWGAPGDGPGQFANVHYVAVGPDGTVYIADRENHRIQLFDPDGKYLAQWTGFTMPSDLALGHDTVYVTSAEGLSLLGFDGSRKAHLPAHEPHPNTFRAHGIWLDAAENIYLAQSARIVSRLERLT